MELLHKLATKYGTRRERETLEEDMAKLTSGLTRLLRELVRGKDDAKRYVHQKENCTFAHSSVGPHWKCGEEYKCTFQ
jgi:hypothetical protein